MVPYQGAAYGEQALYNLIRNPCTAPLVGGYALGTAGIVQRFVKYVTPIATTETAFAFIFNPLIHSASGITQIVGTPGSTTPSITATASPGETFLDANADNVAVNAACLELVYTGTLMNRSGFIGVCQGPSQLLNTADLGTFSLNDLMALCQTVGPVPSKAVEIKWSPTMREFTAGLQQRETSSHEGNTLMVVVVGAKPTDFTARFTSVVEYVPKSLLGIPVPRPTLTMRVGVGERIISALDRQQHWWHNLGDAAGAAMRLGASMYYGLEQGARLIRGVPRLAEATTALLALTG